MQEFSIYNESDTNCIIFITLVSNFGGCYIIQKRHFLIQTQYENFYIGGETMKKQYTIQELLQLLDIGESTYKRRKDEILTSYLPIYWEYHTEYQKGKLIFVIDVERAEIQPLPHKKKSVEMTKFYEKEVDKIVTNKPWNSGANIARKIRATNNKFNHAQSTIEHYVRPVLKSNYTITEKQWVESDMQKYDYYPLTSEQLDYLKSLFQKHIGGNSELIANVLADHESGLIDSENAMTIMKQSFVSAMNEFIDRYGFRPIKIGKYQRNAIDEEYAAGRVL